MSSDFNSHFPLVQDYVPVHSDRPMNKNKVFFEPDPFSRCQQTLPTHFTIYIFNICISFIFPKFKILQVKQTERPFCCLACFCPLATAPRDHTTDPRRSFLRSKDPDCSARVCQTGEDRLRPDTFLRRLSPNQVNNVSKFLLSIDLSFYCSSHNGKMYFTS